MTTASCQLQLAAAHRELAEARSELHSLRAIAGLENPATCSADLLDACGALRAGCHSSAPGSPSACLKASLTELLPSDERVASMRRRHHTSASWYFLCAGSLPVGNVSARAQALTELLRRADGDDEARRQYAAASSCAALATWTAAEKVAHYLTALPELSDSLHVIDQLALALGSGEDPAWRRHRGLLLHYAFLRGLVQHPEQRPLQPLTRGLSARMFWPGLNWTEQLQAHVPEMQRELLAAASLGASPPQAEGLHVGDWREEHLIVEEEPLPMAASRFPLTLALLRESGARPINARISRLRTGTHIGAHCGVSNAKLRVHVGLSVPPCAVGARCALRVGAATREWEEGGVLVFDDSFEHEAWWGWRAGAAGGEGPQAPSREAVPSLPPPEEARGADRVVLIVDVWHPELEETQKAQLRRTFSRSRAAPAGAGVD